MVEARISGLFMREAKAILICLAGALFACDKPARTSRPLEPRATEIENIRVHAVEVTVQDYMRCVQVGECPSWHLPDEAQAAKSYCNANRRRRTEHPMNCITPEDAKTFCAWWGGRLPSIDEWERIATNDSTTPYPWGREYPSCDTMVIARLRQHPRPGAEWIYGCGKDSTWEVGTHPRDRTESGVWDLGGNISEFVITESGYAIRGNNFMSVRLPEELSKTKTPDLDVPPSTVASSFWSPLVGFRCVAEAGK